jgi:hypothetical protein
MHEILRDASPPHEARLIFINQGLNLQLQAGGESFTDGLDQAILQRDRSKRAGSKHAGRFWEKDYMSPIDAAQVSRPSVEIGEEAVQVQGDEVPGSPIEARLEPIWAGGTGTIHPPDCVLDLLAVERSGEGGSVDMGGAVVEEFEVEPPDSGARPSQQVAVEGVEGSSLPLVVDDVQTIDGDGIPAQALRGPRMEELCVLVPFMDGSGLPALFPIGCLLLDGEGESIASSTAEGELVLGEGSVPFKEIEKINQEFTVIIMSGGISVSLFPNLGSGPEAFRFGGEGGSTITARHGAVPVRDGSGKEGGIEEPHIFKPEDSGRGDGGGGSDYKGDVIGCRARERGER